MILMIGHIHVVAIQVAMYYANESFFCYREVTELNMQRKWEITHFLERCVKYLFPCILNSNAPTTSSQSVMTSSRDVSILSCLGNVVCP
jgi:hypothetical protein